MFGHLGPAVERAACGTGNEGGARQAQTGTDAQKGKRRLSVDVVRTGGCPRARQTLWPSPRARSMTEFLASQRAGNQETYADLIRSIHHLQLLPCSLVVLHLRLHLALVVAPPAVPVPHRPVSRALSLFDEFSRAPFELNCFRLLWRRAWSKRRRIFPRPELIAKHHRAAPM